jgi:hypothetical protein
MPEGKIEVGGSPGGGHREQRSPGAYFLRGSYRPEEPIRYS